MMSNLGQQRRGFIRGLATLLVAPAIVQVSSLMPISVLAQDTQLITRIDILYGYLYVCPEWQLSLPEFQEAFCNVQA